MVVKSAAEHMWLTLEHELGMPAAKDIKHLSGLLDDDIQRFSHVWAHLPVEVRRKLIHTLGHTAETDFEMDFSAIFRIAIGDADAEVRATAIEGLFEDEDVRLISQFAKILEKDTAVEVRSKAAQALAHFVLLGELEKIRPQPFESARNALLTAYTNPQEDLEVCRRAIESLAYTELDGVAELIAAAYVHSQPDMRLSAVFAMGRSADKRWASIVLQELSNPLPAMRYEATRACGELRIQEAVRTLVELVEDVDTEVQEMALWSLGQIGGNLARKTLYHYSQSDNEALQDAAKAALEELEFFHGDLSTFFGPPSEFDGGGNDSWDSDDLDEMDDLDDLFEDADDIFTDTGSEDTEDEEDEATWMI